MLQRNPSENSSRHPVSSYDERARTAFVFAGGGSFGAIHVGMLHSPASRGIAADMVVGSSVSALNGAYYAGNSTIEGIQRLDTIWRGLRRSDVFPLAWRTIMGFLYRRDFLVTSDAPRQIVEENLGYRNVEDANSRCISLRPTSCRVVPP
jgi:NTE family protein